MPHTTGTTHAAVLRSAYIDPAGCPVRWRIPTPLIADELLVALIARLERDGLPDRERRRAEVVVFDVLTPAETATISLTVPADARAGRVAAALLADPADRRTLEQWGRTVGASARTLARVFAAETRQGFGAWRTSVRMAAALELLAGGQPVARTARLVGYETTGAFVAAFGRVLGETPGRYFAPRSPARPGRRVR